MLKIEISGSQKAGIVQDLVDSVVKYLVKTVDKENRESRRTILIGFGRKRYSHNSKWFVNEEIMTSALMERPFDLQAFVTRYFIIIEVKDRPEIESYIALKFPFK